MIGFNGGLIGRTRATTLGPSVPGVWTAREQLEALRNLAWPLGDVDLDYANVTLLLHGDGINNSTTFTDNSPSPKTVTGSGNAKISTTQFKFGGASMAFDGTGDFLSATSSDFNLASSDFTWEGWFYINNSSDNVVKIFMNNYTSFGGQSIFWGKHTVASGKVVCYIANQNNAAPLLTESTYPPNADWVHYALVRNGSLLKMYRNGVETASSSITQPATSNTLLQIGGSTESSGAFSLNGFIDDVRITKMARYTTAFTPSPTPFPNQ